MMERLILNIFFLFKFKPRFSKILIISLIEILKPDIFSNKSGSNVIVLVLYVLIF